MDILLAAATRAEIAPTIDWLQGQGRPGSAGVEVLITGVGLMAATFALTRQLSLKKYDLVLVGGIAGAFDHALSLGDCVLVESEQLGDLGAEDHEEFIDVFNLGFLKPEEAPFRGAKLINELDRIPLDIGGLRRVSGLTVHTVSGNARTIAGRTARYGAQVESMEGAAQHYVCLQLGVPFLQLRAISNFVTPRDRPAWEVAKAVMALNEQLIAWLAQRP